MMYCTGAANKAQTFVLYDHGQTYSVFFRFQSKGTVGKIFCDIHVSC